MTGRALGLRAGGLWSRLDEIVFLNLRNPRRKRVLQGAALCLTLALVSYLATTRPPDGTVKTATDQTAGPAIRSAGKVPESGPSAPPRNIEKQLTARSGDTLIAMFTNAAISPPVAYRAIAAMRKVFDPRDLQPGHTITATFRPRERTGEDPEFIGFVFEPDIDYTIRVDRGPDGEFTAKRIDRDLDQRVARVGGVIRSNLYGDGVKAGLPPGILIEMIRLFSWDIDFQRDIQPGDAFSAMVEQSQLKDGQVAGWGNLLYAEITLSGKTRRYYRFESTGRKGHKIVDYYDERGRSARRALLRTPVDGARLSSRYGRRRHPILGYTRMHRGVDFAAPSGTPIYAAGDGTIAVAGRKGGYGRYIRIRHNGHYSTAYAHMRRLARGMHRGKRVKQGQVIGYVGSTGLSTGPHLHYEVLAGGQQVNPLRLNLPSGRNLAGKELRTFQSVRVFVDRRLAKLSGDTRLTSR